MATIDEVIQQEANPFDPVTFKTGNFWQSENATVTSPVNSIHHDAIDQITQLITLVAKDHHTRTALLLWDQGSGKSYVLKRIKETLNSKAFFVYIPPFVDSEYIWRHTLQQTVDSLMHKPEGEEESQLLLWLKNLSVFSDQKIMRKLLGERSLFINTLKSAYPTGIYQAKEFFGALYDLNNPDLYLTACSWLRGEDLDEEDLQALRVKRSIDSEASAQKVLASFGRISTSIYPIVLCFDQVDLLCQQASINPFSFQQLFNISTTFHNEYIKNYLILISMTTDSWSQNNKYIPLPDKARLEKVVALKSINLDQAEALWTSRLYPLHSLAKPKPSSKIYPLTREALEEKFPGGKTTPRRALILAHQLLLQHKLKTADLGDGSGPAIETDSIAAFKLLWQKELSITEQKVKKIRHFSEPELVSMLGRVLAALQIKIQPKLLPSPTYTSYSFSYQEPKQSNKKGLIWAENPSKTFFHTMNSCALVEKNKSCQEMYLIRAESSGKANTKGYKAYKEIFIDSPSNRHIKPDLESVHHLATYDRLVNSTHCQELVIAGKTLSLSELETLVRNSGVLSGCALLQDLGIFPKGDSTKPCLDKEKDFLLSFVRIHHLIARRVVTQTTIQQFPKLAAAEIEQLIQNLCQEKQIRILDESAKLNEQIICLIPSQQMGQ